MTLVASMVRTSVPRKLMSVRSTYSHHALLQSCRAALAEASRGHQTICDMVRVLTRRSA
jgi:hypothetical protein